MSLAYRNIGFYLKIWIVSSTLTLIFCVFDISNVIGKRILKSRPYGGVGCLINQKHANKMKSVAKYDRYLAVTLDDNLIVNIYLPLNK